MVTVGHDFSNTDLVDEVADAGSTQRAQAVSVRAVVK
ncbi:hypothetical protein MKAN_23450 [Mycobacterium kansasii ATCC 12478]|uniref:Uncharacterized protein n=1 Tax=Mycobacterium kansasii ATCC 12478 TaxID=557599 RepID=U5X264_MYCKA|nr:hypothetical protein MKAN_23450 [Mycobacterium kansasii ATCC 12478]